jgi:hypothetical protein
MTRADYIADAEVDAIDSAVYERHVREHDDPDLECDYCREMLDEVSGYDKEGTWRIV